MLLLTRRIGERIKIGDEIEIIVCNIDYNSVRIGINAPHDVEVHREEIYRKIQDQKTKNRASAFEKPQRQTLVRSRRY